MTSYPQDKHQERTALRRGWAKTKTGWLPPANIDADDWDRINAAVLKRSLRAAKAEGR